MKQLFELNGIRWAEVAAPWPALVFEEFDGYRLVGGSDEPILLRDKSFRPLSPTCRGRVGKRVFVSQRRGVIELAMDPPDSRWVFGVSAGESRSWDYARPIDTSLDGSVLHVVDARTSAISGSSRSWTTEEGLWSVDLETEQVSELGLVDGKVLGGGASVAGLVLLVKRHNGVVAVLPDGGTRSVGPKATIASTDPSGQSLLISTIPPCETELSVLSIGPKLPDVAPLPVGSNAVWLSSDLILFMNAFRHLDTFDVYSGKSRRLASVRANDSAGPNDGGLIPSAPLVAGDGRWCAWPIRGASTTLLLDVVEGVATCLEGVAIAMFGGANQ